MMTNCATLSWRLMPRSCLLTAEVLVASAGFFGSLGRVAAPASAAHMLIAISARNEGIHLHFTAKDILENTTVSPDLRIGRLSMRGYPAERAGRAIFPQRQPSGGTSTRP